jgi:hypothetical protein
VVPALLDSGLEETCSPLIDVLTVARKAPTPLTVHDQLEMAGYIPGPSTVSFRCDDVLYRDLPLLRPASSAPASIDPALLDVSRGVQDMVTKARTVRNNHLNVRAGSRRPMTTRECMGDAISEHLLLLGHIDNEEALSALFHAWGAVPEVCLNVG